MSDEQTTVPEGTTTTEQPNDASHWQAEARKAFEARQKAKAEADDLRKRLEAMEKADRERAEQAEMERATKAGEFDKAKQQLIDKHMAELQNEQKARQDAETRLRQTLIGRAFADASDLFGPTGKTIYLPSDAERIFGDRVRIQDDGSLAVVDATGDVILDPKTGKPAAFATAMAEVIDRLPDKQYRLRGSGKTGSGSSGGGSVREERIDLTNLTPEQRRDPKVLAQLRASLPRGAMVFGRAYEQQ